MISKSVKITNHGMINIPAPIRKKFGLKDGDDVMVMIDDEGFIKIYPIIPIEKLREGSYTAKEMLDELECSHKEDLELEM